MRTSFLPPNSNLLDQANPTSDFYNEDRASKIFRRLREEPLVPLGCGLTVWAIVGATRSMRQGNHKATNMYFRRRLYAQAFTIACLVAGNVYWQKDRVKRKEYEKLVEERKRMERRERWLKELEMRDEEEKAWKERLGRGGRQEGVVEMVEKNARELKDRVVGDK
jgi:hypothetical protein